jgi:hypothetical protein
MRHTLLLVLLVTTAASPAAAQSCATLGGRPLQPDPRRSRHGPRSRARMRSRTDIPRRPPRITAHPRPSTTRSSTAAASSSSDSAGRPGRHAGSPATDRPANKDRGSSLLAARLAIRPDGSDDRIGARHLR